MMELKKKIKSIIDGNFILSCFYYYLYYKIPFLLKKDVLVIHTPGHIGSSSIAFALRKQKLQYLFYNIHSLHEKLKKDTSISSISPRHHLQHMLKNNIKKNLHRKNWRIITIVRDPVDRAVTGFLQGLNTWIPNFRYTNYKTHQVAFKELKYYFFQKKMFGDKSFLDATNQHCTNWFDSEVKFFFDLDIYDTAFPKEKGYYIYTKDNVNLLVLKFEYLTDIFQEAINDFLKIENSNLSHENTAMNRGGTSYEYYKYFKENIKLPHKLLENIYNSKYMKYFYSDIDIEKFIGKWKI